jgi:hypothetical protein
VLGMGAQCLARSHVDHGTRSEAESGRAAVLCSTEAFDCVLLYRPFGGTAQVQFLASVWESVLCFGYSSSGCPYGMRSACERLGWHVYVSKMQNESTWLSGKRGWALKSTVTAEACVRKSVTSFSPLAMEAGEHALLDIT